MKARSKDRAVVMYEMETGVHSSTSGSRLFGLTVRLWGHESAFVRIRDDFIDLRPDFVQITFQRPCVLKLAVRFGFFNERLQESFLLE
jgi:hypothetical protein